MVDPKGDDKPKAGATNKRGDVDTPAEDRRMIAVDEDAIRDEAAKAGKHTVPKPFAAG